MDYREFQQLNERLFELTQFNRGGKVGGGQQPHKPLLLLALADRIAEGVPQNDQIPIDELLKEYFEHYWRTLRPVDNKPGNIAMPLTRLPNDGIFTLRNPALHGKENPNFNQISKDSPTAWLNEKWFNLFKNPETREAFKENVIQYYFLKQYEQYRFIDPEKDPNLNRQARKIKERVAPDPKEIYERSLAFRELIKKHYKFTCSVSGTYIKAGDYNLLEAAHIQDFAISGNDSLPNGIALNPFMHKAFDMGLFTIEYHKSKDKPYRIRVSDRLKEAEDGGLKLWDLQNKPLKKLPDIGDYAPSIESLEWHQECRFENFLK